MDFEAQALKLLAEIKTEVGGLSSSVLTNTKTIENHSFRLTWLERFVYGAAAVGGTFLFLFPHIGPTIAHYLEVPQEHQTKE